jgi:hypothetical protein
MGLLRDVTFFLLCLALLSLLLEQSGTKSMIKIDHSVTKKKQFALFPGF